MRMGFLTLSLVLLAPVAAIAADPPVVFQVQQPGKVLADVRAVVKLAAGNDAVEKLNDAIVEKLGAKGLDGLDLDRPVLGYVATDKTIEDIVVVVAVPVTGEKEFLGLLERLNVPKPKATKTGIYEFPTEGDDGQVRMRFEGQHAYIALGKKDPSAALAAKALVPAAKLYDPHEKSLAFARVHFDRMSKELRAGLGEQLKELKAKLDTLKLPGDASEAARKAVDELIALGNRYTDLLQDAQTATARVVLDGDSGEAAVEIGLTGMPGSKLAQAIASRQPSTNKFAGLITPDTATGMKLQLPFFAKELQNAAVIGLEAGQKTLAETAPPQFKGLIDETFKGLIRTVNTGEADIAFALRGPDKAGLYSVVAAFAFEDPSGVEKELRALYKTELPPMFQSMIVLDAAKVGKTSIHQAKIGGMLPAELQKLFGEEASVTLAFAPHGIFIAFGPDAVKTLKSALEKDLKGPSPAFEAVSNPSRLRKLMEAAGQALPKDVLSQDRLYSAYALTIEGGKELRLRLSGNINAFGGAAAFVEQAARATAPPTRIVGK